MFGVGFSEVIVIVLLGVLLFGADLPKMAYQLGRLVRKLQRGLNQFKDDIDWDKKD